MYMRHKYVDMDVNSAFLKLTNAMACAKIILNVKQKSLLTRIPQLSTIFVLLAVLILAFPILELPLDWHSTLQITAMALLVPGRKYF